jgi:hypothetical protein
MHTQKHSDETKRRIGQKSREWYQNPENRKRVSELALVAQNRPEVVARKSQSSRETQSRPEIREKYRLASLGHAPHEGAGKTKWRDYTRRDGSIVKVQGTYEYEVAGFLDDRHEEWLYTGSGIYFEHILSLSDGRRYYPDFYLPRLNLYLDPKGYVWEDDREKYELVAREYSNVMFLVGSTYLDQLKGVLSERD